MRYTFTQFNFHSSLFTHHLDSYTFIMEAERVNAIAAHIQDLARRAAELRRYL